MWSALQCFWLLIATACAWLTLSILLRGICEIKTPVVREFNCTGEKIKTFATNINVCGFNCSKHRCRIVCAAQSYITDTVFCVEICCFTEEGFCDINNTGNNNNNNNNNNNITKAIFMVQSSWQTVGRHTNGCQPLDKAHRLEPIGSDYTD